MDRFAPAPREVATAFFDERNVPPQVRLMQFPWSLFDMVCVNPEFADSFYAYVADYVNVTMAMPPRRREMIILRVAVVTNAPYERQHHEAVAETVGLPADDRRRIIEGPDAMGFSEEDSAVLRAVDDLVLRQRIGDSAWQDLSRTLDHAALLEVIALTAAYLLAAMVLKTFDVPNEKP
jgi:alkylhydroperoxidase family enzyme